MLTTLSEPWNPLLDEDPSWLCSFWKTTSSRASESHVRQMLVGSWGDVDRTDSATEVAYGSGLDSRFVFLDIIHTGRLC